MGGMGPNDLLIPRVVTREDSSTSPRKHASRQHFDFNDLVPQDGHKAFREFSFEGYLVPEQENGSGM